MERFIIQGGRKLSGSIQPQGSKNEALQILCATLLTTEWVEVINLPAIHDVKRLIKMLKLLGVVVERISETSYRFCAKNIDPQAALSVDFLHTVGELRGSVMLIAPLLYRFGRLQLPSPGGDKIGRRRLDTHIQGLSALGLAFEYDKRKELYTFWIPDHFHSANILLEEASVTGTANLLMAAATITDTTELYHAASEPYIQQLCHLLTAMGAQIQGIGTNRLRIKGTDQLGGATHQIQADIIEISSFIGMAALTASEIHISSANLAHMDMSIHMFEKLGIEVIRQTDSLLIPAQPHYKIRSFIDGSIMNIYDGTWPALSPDLISIGIVTALQAEGAVLFHQRMFESRLFFVDKLINMGGKLILCDPHRVTVIGLARQQALQSIRMTSPDIRAGIALLLAALSAEGESIIENIEQIDRGYTQIEKRLTSLGASITRVSD